MNSREIVRASAGSGKTFRISSRMIGLLASGQPPSSVLASTFTRKAAGEILDRVLLRVARAALDPKEAADLGVQTVAVESSGDVTTDQDFWANVLGKIVAELGHLEVSTLDSFFARILRAFSNEMGLLPGWTIADATRGERLRSEALELLFNRQDRGMLVELVRALHPGEVRRSIYERLVDDIDEIVAAHRDLGPDGPGWSAIRTSVPPLPNDLAELSLDLAEQILEVEVPRTKVGQPNSRWAKAAEALAIQVREQDWSSLVSGGLATKVLEAGPDGVPTYYRAEFPSAILSATHDAIELARTVIGDRLAMRANALSRLAELYDATYLERIRSTSILRFDDVTRLVAGWDGVSTTAPSQRADFFFRLGSSRRHVLLDEFQDTSLLQWRALTPILDRLVGSDALDAAGEPGAAVIVADPKQSIYGWRGAAPAVVDAVGKRYELKHENLAVSWRSSGAVLEAVNRVFDNIDEQPVLNDDPDDAATAGKWKEAFTPHVPAERDPPLPGRVRLIAGAELESRGNHQPVYFRSVAAHVARLHAEMPGLSIGVLTRRNHTVGQIILELGALGVPASQEGGTPLGDSPAIASIFALLRLADHPVDGLARYHVANTPLGQIAGLDNARDIQAALRVSQRVRRRLLNRGYGPYLSDLVGRLKHACDSRERARLRHLVELGYRWDRSPRGESLRVSDFLARAISESVQSSGNERVRVMTIHQSKGLEFDAVVLPELHGATFSRARGASPPIAYRPHDTSRVTHLFPGMSQGIADLFAGIPELTEGRRQARASAVRDSLGMLYVAMTRARYALDMVVPADPPRGGTAKPSQARTHARLIRECLGVSSSDRPITEGETVIQAPEHDLPEGWWKGLVQDEVPEDQGHLTLPGRIELATDQPRTRQLERTSPSSKEGGTAVDVHFLLGLTDLGGSARARGTLVHAWLEHLEWIEDGLVSVTDLLRIAQRHTPDLPPELVQEHLDWTRARLDAPEVRAVLSRSSAAEDAEVLAEMPFLVRDGDALMEGIIDRLVLTRDGDRVTSAAILDYKTDALTQGDEAALSTRVDHYRPQMEAYRGAVASLYGLDVTEVSGELIFLGVGRVRSV
jgi:ATP-dependent helicase/nuclease subunit A